MIFIICSIPFVIWVTMAWYLLMVKEVELAIYRAVLAGFSLMASSYWLVLIYFTLLN